MFKGTKRMSFLTIILAISLLVLGACSSSGTSSKSSTASGNNNSDKSSKQVPVPKTIDDLNQFTNLDSSGKKKSADLTIAFAQTDLNTPWRIAEMDNFKEWAKKLGVKFIWNQADENVSKELTNVQNLLAKKPDVLIVDPIATEPLTPVINLAKTANVPLVVVDRELSQKPGAGTYQLFIGANQFVIGNQSAKLWVEKLKKEQKTESPKANLALIEGGVGQQPTTERNKGVKAAIKDYPGIKIVATQSGDWTRQGGREVMEGFIQKFPAGQLQGVFAASDEMMLGALQALDAANRDDLNGWFFTGDGQLEGLQKIVDGTNIADTQNPPFYGEASLKAAIAITQGVNFSGATINLNNETFTNMTPDELQKTKDYVKKITDAGSKF